MVSFPVGYELQTLQRSHPRAAFRCGEPAVEDWIATKAWQNQDKHLSSTKVLIDPGGEIAGYYSLAAGQIDFGDLPPEVVKKLPSRMLPVAVLAWLGVATPHQGAGLGQLLLAQALQDCYEAGKTFPFIAVVLDCINEQAKAFYSRWDFQAIPGHPLRLYLSTQQLTRLVAGE